MCRGSSSEHGRQAWHSSTYLPIQIRRKTVQNTTHTNWQVPKQDRNSLRLDTSYWAKELTGLLKPDTGLRVWSWCSWKRLRDKKLKMSQMHNIPKPPKNYTGITWTLISSPWNRSLPFARSQEVKNNLWENETPSSQVWVPKITVPKQSRSPMPRNSPNHRNHATETCQVQERLKTSLHGHLHQKKRKFHKW